MHKRVGRKTTKLLAPEPEDDAAAAEHGNESHVHKYRRLESARD